MNGPNYQLPTATPLFEEQPIPGFGDTFSFVLMSFIVFTVAFAVVRSLFNRAFNGVDEKRSNWKESIKNKVRKFNRNLDEKKINDPEAKEKFIDPKNKN